MLGAIGDFLPLAMTVALSPFPIIAMVMLLGGPEGARRGVGFTLGWIAGLSLATSALVLMVSGVEARALGLGAGLQIALGLGLFAAAARKWRTRPRRGAEVALPRWAAALDRISSARAAGLGVMLGLNPKNLALAVAAAAIIAEHGLTGRAAVLTGLVFAALGSASVIGALVLRARGGARGARSLEDVKRFMLRNNNVIMMVLLGVVGAKVLGDGLAALGG